MGVETQKSYLKKLGLFSKSSIEVPEKSNAIFPKGKRWGELSGITIGYGHGLATTPMNFIEAFLTIVKDGHHKNLTLLHGRNNSSNSVKVFKKSTVKLVQKMLRLTAKYGFAEKANVDEYLVGAKTGTPEKILQTGGYNKKVNTPTSIAAFPINDPKYIVFVLIDEPKGNALNKGFATGGMVAAPIIGNIIKSLAPVLNVAPVEQGEKAVIENTYNRYVALNTKNSSPSTHPSSKY